MSGRKYPIHTRSWPAALSMAAAVLSLTRCAPDPEITSDDGATMLLIPEGEFTMGAEEGELAGFEMGRYLNYEAERPSRRVSLSSFYVDRNEVTNARYRKFLEHVKASGDEPYRHPEQPGPSDYNQELMTEDLAGDEQPAVCVSWYNAYSYCQWAGKRLPTEAEWEYAARGGDPYRKFPWGGGEPDGDGIWWANYQPGRGRGADGYRSSAPVGSFPDGVSPFGLLDMAGNVEEWVQDWHDPYFYRRSRETRNPTGPATGRNKVIKGGSYGTDKWHIRVATRLFGSPSNRSVQLGFRCARDL